MKKKRIDSAVLRRITGFVKKNAVMVIALFAAVITMLFVPPDKAYLGYFDFKTLTCLFCVLAVVCALKDIRFFRPTSMPRRMPSAMLIAMEIRLIFSAAHRPPSRRAKFLPLNRTSSPKLCMPEPPFDQASQQ